MTGEIHKNLAVELAPDLAFQVAAQYLKDRGYPEPAWDS